MRWFALAAPLLGLMLTAIGATQLWFHRLYWPSIGLAWAYIVATQAMLWAHHLYEVGP